MKENDLLIIKAVAAILEYMSNGPQDVKYTGDVLSMLSEQLMNAIENIRSDKIE